MTFGYIRVDDTLVIHTDQIDRFGGSRGARDPGVLAEALFRSQTGYYSTLIDEAVALRESLSQNYHFINGNERTAFAAIGVSLLPNGLKIIATDRMLKSLYCNCMAQIG